MRRGALVLVLLAGALASCRATSVAYRFTPSPLEALVQDPASGAVVARVLVGVPGAERRGHERSGYPELLVRIRVENKSANTMTFDPDQTILIGSDTAVFGPPTAVPPGPMTILPGEANAALLRYPFPRDGSLEAPLLTGVNLQFELSGATEALEMSVHLERNEPEVVVDPGPAFTFGTGFYYGRW